MAAEQHQSEREVALRAFQETAKRYAELLTKRGDFSKPYHRYARNKAIGLHHTLVVVLHEKERRYVPYVMITTGNAEGKSPIHPRLHQDKVPRNAKSKVKSAFCMESEEDLQCILSGKPSTHMVKMIQEEIYTPEKAAFMRKELSREIAMAQKFYGPDALFFLIEYKKGKRIKCMLFMPRIKGTELFDYFIENRSTLSILERLRLMRACVYMAQNLETAGIVHADLNLGNMMCDIKVHSEGGGLDFEVNPVDFETAFEEKEGPLFMEAGTLGYSSPELYRYNCSEEGRKPCKDITCKTDLYSIGCIMLNILRQGGNENPAELGIKNRNTFDNRHLVGFPFLISPEGKLHKNTFIYPYMKRLKNIPTPPIIALIEALLATDPFARPSSEIALGRLDEVILCEEVRGDIAAAYAIMPPQAAVGEEAKVHSGSKPFPASFFSTAEAGQTPPDNAVVAKEEEGPARRKLSSPSFFEETLVQDPLFPPSLADPGPAAAVKEENQEAQQALKGDPLNRVS